MAVFIFLFSNFYYLQRADIQDTYGTPMKRVLDMYETPYYLLTSNEQVVSN